MKRWSLVSFAMVCLVGSATAAGTSYTVEVSWSNPYHTGDLLPTGFGFYTCYLKFDGAWEAFTTWNGYGQQLFATQITGAAGEGLSVTIYAMDNEGNLTTTIPASLTVIPATSPPAPQNQDPQIHPVQPTATVGEPVDAATGYLRYSQTLLRQLGAQALDYTMYGNFGSTLPVSLCRRKAAASTITISTPMATTIQPN